MVNVDHGSADANELQPQQQVREARLKKSCSTLKQLTHRLRKMLEFLIELDGVKQKKKKEASN